jgi:dTDP-4-amino-4,6-dideoxygalactose transaminase
MGLCNLPYVPEIIGRRKNLSQYYDNALQNLRVTRPECRDAEACNYAYYPIIFESEEDLLEAMSLLNQKEIFPRRYFYPTLSELPYVEKKNEVLQADKLAKRVLCLPLYHELTEAEIDMIARLLLRSQNY